MIWGFAQRLFSFRASGRGVVLRDLWGTAITGDIKGNVVVVNGERYAFSLHIPRVRDPVPENIESLLTWRSRIPKKLHGRESELAELRRWCNEPADVRVRILCGEGGAGKSRLTFELAEILRGEGWQAGQLSEPTHPVAFPLAGQGILLIIDYPEQFSAAVERLLRLLKNSELPGLRLRLLLLSRNREAMQSLIDRHIEPLRSPEMELKPLQSEDVCWALFQDAWRQMAELRRVSSALPLDNRDFNGWLQRDPAHAQPLILLSFALNLFYDPTATQLGRAEILQRLVQRERDRITEEAKHHGLQPEGVILLKALAAIPGRLTASGIAELAEQPLPHGIMLPTAIELQRTTLCNRGALQEIQPDLLASVLLHAVMRDWLPDSQTAGPLVWSALTTEAPPDEELRGRLRRIARLSADRPRSVAGEVFPNSIVTALAHFVGKDAELADRIDTVINRESARGGWTLQPLALAAALGAVQISERQAQENFGVYAPALAASLSNLSVRLGDAGDHTRGLAVIRRAVEIYEQLAQQDFAEHGPSLASSLNNLSIRLAESGDRTGGLGVIRRAVDIHEQLARENFTRYAPDLAMSLNNLSVRLAESGDRPGGLAIIRRAVEIYEQLAQENFAVYASDLAMGLNNLSIRLAESGDRAGGLVAIRRAVTIREQLAKENFALYAPDLAKGLGNLSVRLASSGERAEGLAANRRSVEIYEQLAQESFVAYAPELAMGLNNLSIRLDESGDHPAGLAAIRRAVQIREQLAQQNFAAYAPGLATSLNNLSGDLATSGDREGGLVASRRAVEIYEQLARENLAAYAPNLASSLNNLAILLAESGDNEGGLAAIHRAVEIREQLVRENFAAYAPRLAMSLSTLSGHLATSGDRAGGLVAGRRATAIYEQLAQENLAAYAPALASSLNNLSILLAELGDGEAGLTAIRRAVEIREQLARENFAAYAPDLANSLNNLSIDLINSGDHPQGLEAIRRAVQIREAMAEKDFTAHAPALAVSLHNLSIRLADVSDHVQAIATLDRAIELIRPFAAAGTELHDRYELMQKLLRELKVRELNLT